MTLSTSAIDAVNAIWNADNGSLLDADELAPQQGIAASTLNTDDVSVTNLGSSKLASDGIQLDDSLLAAEPDVGFAPAQASVGISTHDRILASAGAIGNIGARAVKSTENEVPTTEVDDEPSIFAGIMGCGEIITSERKTLALRFLADDIDPMPDPWRPPGFGEDRTVGDGGVCLSDATATLQEVRDWAIDHVDRIPTLYKGENYQSAIASRLPDVEFLCDEDEAGDLAFYRSSVRNTVFFARGFFDPGPILDLAMALVGPTEFRGAIFAHEMTHLVDKEDLEQGVAEKPSCGPPDDLLSDEYRAGFIQAKMMQLSDCSAEVFGCAYYRKEAGQSGWSNAYRLLGEVFDCLFLPSGAIITALYLGAALGGPGIAVLTGLIGVELASLIIGIALGIV